MTDIASPNLDDTLGILRAAAEETRLRILALLAEGELSVSDLTERGAAPRILRPLLQTLDRADQRLLDDRTRLAAVRSQRSQAAQAFFSRLAPEWDRIRSLHAPEAVVEAAVLDALGTRSIRNLVDLGTGTGRMLQLLAPRAHRTVGLDASHAMLSVARANLEKAGLRGIELRQGDIYAPPFPRDTFDLVVIHQVLHYLDDPARAIREAARLVAPGGRILVVDFAPHNLEFLREAQAHRRLGFAPEQVAAWLDEAGLECALNCEIAPPKKGDEHLTVSL